MTARPFVHLRLHSEFSIVDGIVRVDDVVKQAAADGMPALAITDLSNLFGAVKFFQGARKAGVQPIIGCDVWLENAKVRDQPSRLLLLCASREGYHNLCVLLTRAYTENMYRGRAEMKREWLAGEGIEGLIALSGAEAGDIGQAIAQGKQGEAQQFAAAWQRDFGTRFYVEVQRPEGKGKKSESYIDAALAIASKLDLPVVATHPVQFLKREDFKAHEARVCISQGMILGDPRRKREFSPEHYFKSSAEMAELFSDLPEALENAAEIARRCNFEFTLGKSKLPQFPTPNGESIEDYLKISALEGLEKRLAVLYPDEAKRNEVRPNYVKRLDYETGVIIQMGFPGYFLIVADFINWAKNNGVPVGPGRGSGAGSLVAYSLGITDLDPLAYDLIFERFLNPERVSMPDFDVDFCQYGRDRVIDYVKQKYGAESVSQIATFGTMAAKAVIRDVGRVLGMGYNYVDSIAKLIPNELGITLEKAMKDEPQFNERMEAEEEVRELMELALKLEGMTRNVGMHAGGVLIAPGKLTDFTPLYCADGSSGIVSQYDKDDVEQVGLVKFDFLGLTTLTILAEAERNVRSLGETGFDLNKIPLVDSAAFEIFTKGNTVAIFQFESRGMRDMLVRARPDRLEDLIALNALYRPGPMDSIPDFCDRKTGKARPEYLDARVEPILSPTYGVMVYQEQVMQIAQVIAGYSLGGADLLRRAMGKKKPEEMAQQRSIFNEGAAKNSVTETVATKLFDAMEKFAGYGFNKSHSAPYAFLGYQTAWLKARHSAAFMAANLSMLMDDTDKVQLVFDDTKKNGVEILPPDINSGTYRFVPLDRKTIRYGLGAVKGTGQSAIENIVAARAAKGPFKDLLDFVQRIDRRVVNRRAMEAMIRAGAFDVINPHRHSLLASLGNAIEMAEQAEKNASQVSLFGDAEAASGEALALVQVKEWSEREKLLNEKQALGFYLSGHPFDTYAAEVRQLVRTQLKDIQPRPETMLLAGILYGQRVRNGRRGRMAILTLDDGGAKVEVVVYNEVFNEKRAMIQDDHLLIVEGKVSYDEFSGGMRVVADNIMDMESARQRYARRLELSINGQANAAKLKQLLAPYQPGNCSVMIHYRNGIAEMDVMLPETHRVRLSESLIQSLEEWLSAPNVAVKYEAVVPTARPQRYAAYSNE
jgi:DNA polymerase-3 subunit alpha